MKYRLLVLMEGLVHQRKKIINDFSKAGITFYLSFHCKDDNSYSFINGKEIFKFKTINKNVNFPTQFCLGSLSNGFGATESREISSKRYVYGFLADYNAIDKSDILNIYNMK